jgi:heme oxygenase (biliverdin-IX-beta and delta-forming)
MKTPILDRLKQATKERHRLLEGKLPLLDPQLSHDKYRCLVSKFYGYYAPMESLVLTLPWWVEVGLNFNERQKMPSLEQNLIVLGYKPETLAQLPRCHHLPEVKSMSQFLGCLYFMEGATLGGAVHRKTVTG